METALIFILAKKLLSDTNNSFIVFVLSSPLRPLSRVASDYFSDSVVCIGILRPLRPLREIKRQSSLICGQFSVRSLSSALCNLFSVLYKNLYIPVCVVLGGGILVSSRLGPRMESAVNMNEQARDNMSAVPRQNDDDDGCPQCTASVPILLL